MIPTRSLKIAAGILLVIALVAIAGACTPAAAPAATTPVASPVATTQAATPVATTSAASAGATAAKTLMVQVDTVRGAAGISKDQAAALTCVQQNRIPQGGEIVWRVRVFDPATGKAMDDKALKSVTLTLPDGKTQALKYGGHPSSQPVDFFWTTGFQIPNDYPTGAFNYKLDAADSQGRTGAFTQFNVASSMLQIVPTGQS